VAASDYFSQVAARLDRPERLETARRAGRKTIALVGMAVPEELFWACDAVPISLGRFVSVGQVANLSYLPRDVCAAARTAFDLLANRWIPAGLVDAVVVAAGCDWIARLTDRIAGAAPVWPLNVSRAVGPMSRGPARGNARPATSAARLGSLEYMLRSLDLLTDLPLTRRAFEAAHRRALALDALCHKLDRSRCESPPRLLASDYYRIVGALDLADPDRWAAEVSALVGTPHSAFNSLSTQHSALNTSHSALRIVLSGCPTGFPDPSLIELIEQAGFQIVGEDSRAHRGSANRTTLPRGGRRALLEWAAETLAIGEEETDVRMVRAASDGGPDTSRRADAVLRIHYRGCAVSAMEETRNRSRPAAQDLPILTIEIEQPSFASEALRTRLEAFREQLSAAQAMPG